MICCMGFNTWKRLQVFCYRAECTTEVMNVLSKGSIRLVNGNDGSIQLKLTSNRHLVNGTYMEFSTVGVY